MIDQFAKFADLGGETREAKLTYFRPGGELTIDETLVTPETEDNPEFYIAESDSKGLPKEPKFSRRRQFAEELIVGNQLIDRAMVNRMWALLIGQGLIHPVDKMDSEHPAVHPELLDWLSNDFRQHGTDVKRLVGGIVRSRVYQLGQAEQVPPHQTFNTALEKPLTAEDLYRSMRVAANGRDTEADESLLFEFQETFPDIFPEEIIANLSQALMLANHPALVALTQPHGGNLTQQVLESADNPAAIRLAFETIYGRDPQPEEQSLFVQHLESSSDRAAAAQQMVWAMLTSPEFRYNH